MGNGISILTNGLSAMLDVAFPPGCAACGTATAGPRTLCEGCRDDLLLFDRRVCGRCSTPVLAADSLASTDCPACRGERWAFDRVHALGPYEGLLRRLVLDTKRASGEATADALGRMLAETHAEWIAEVDLIVPIPQHWTRRLARRADGVAALAQSLATHASKPFAKALYRQRATPPQTSVAPSDRAANVRRAFAVRKTAAIAGRTIALADDVFTTGATCNSAARALIKAGARRVVAVVPARRLGDW